MVVFVDLMIMKCVDNKHFGNIGRDVADGVWNLYMAHHQQCL